MQNLRSWTDKDLSNPREEWDKSQNINHNYNSAGWTNADVSISREEWDKSQNINHNYNSAGWTNADVSVSREEWGKFEMGPPRINGMTPNELIKGNYLFGKELTEEEKQILYQDIMYGYTNDTDMLAKKIDLFLSDPVIIRRIIINCYHLAVKEMSNEKRGYYDNSPRNRKFQFLAITKILMEKGYDLNSLTFEVDSKTIDFIDLLSKFQKDCNKYDATRINDPSWFKNGKAPDNYDKRKVNDPYLYASVLLKEFYYKNLDKFSKAYDNYRKTTRMEPDQIMSYEEFVRQAFGIYVESNENNLKKFNEEREKQHKLDSEVRTQQILKIFSNETEIRNVR